MLTVLLTDEEMSKTLARQFFCENRPNYPIIRQKTLYLCKNNFTKAKE